MEESDALASQIGGERRNRQIRHVGMKLTAVLLFTSSQICHQWHRGKIVQPYVDTLHVSRVEVGRPPNNVLIDEISEMEQFVVLCESTVKI